MRQSNTKGVTIYHELVSIIERDSNAVYDILDVLIYNLNSNELEQLIDKYITTIVDSMSMKDLVDYVKTDYYNSLDKYNEFDLFEDIKYTLDEDFLDEMLLTIKENRRG